LTRIATPVGNAFVTGAILTCGGEAIAGWTVIQRIIPVASGLLFALSGAIGPIVGQNFGARRFDRIRSTARDSLKATLVCVLCVWALPELDDRYLRVILLDDGETVHNALLDRKFLP
jgi:Na+-driven multidrug efflux pump